MNKDSVLCSICARGGSKGVKNKNVRLLNGKPLITYSIEQAIAANIFNHIIVSSDSEEILKTAERAGAEVIFKRPAELASDTSGKLDVIRHALLSAENYYNEKFKYHVDLDATSPLRNVEDILNAFHQFKENNNDILISGTPARRSPYFNLVECDELGRVFLSKQLVKKVLRRQDSPKCYDMNASIYIWKRNALLECDSIFTDKTGLYIMPEERSQDIDCELDFEIVEYILNKKRA